MKRKEEIVTQAVKEQSRLCQPPEWRAGFISGSNWADKTMLEKVCEFFKPRLIAFIGKEDAKELIAEFRQAMEGGAE